MSSRTRADFHAHLDVCEQCANHPFELCGEGARLLELAAGDAAGIEVAWFDPIDHSVPTPTTLAKLLKGGK